MTGEQGLFNNEHILLLLWLSASPIQALRCLVIVFVVVLFSFYYCSCKLENYCDTEI